MPSHFTYDEPDRSSLRQGDVLKKTPELVDLLAEWHPHYAKHAEYKSFLILTQTCDLVRRDDNPASSQYITIAAVRPVEEAIQREAKKYQKWWQEPKHFLDEKGYDKVRQFLERLIDNNEPTYFYLHEDVSLELYGCNCAFLALSIALRIEHYDVCLGAKIAQLTEPFQAKLGWLVGNMYSRVGTGEWDEFLGYGTKSEQAADFLKDLFVILPDEKIEQTLKSLLAVKNLEEYSPDEIANAILKRKIVTKSAQFANNAKISLDVSNFVARMCGALLTQIKDDDVLLGDLRAVFLEASIKSEEIDATVVKTFQRALSRNLTDDVFKGRKKAIDFIVNTILTDSVVKNIIG